MKNVCIFNKKALKKAKTCLCYYCIKEIDIKDIEKSFSEELSCPYCKHKTVLPLEEASTPVIYWVTKMSVSLYG